ncbi:MAG TPA: tRNA pseudouridine(55) synthase TruB [Verrucomicrobiae bacterium]|nr:tRNA pseudouridine(55) synthase TruB [Verrucomicrobiae bacterium]
MDGFIVIDKAPGMTSHDVVQRARRILRIKKIGHTGTLDPFATGVLPLAVGEGTKAIQFLDECEKEYRAVLRLGAATDTQDCTGSTIFEGKWEHLQPQEVLEVLQSAVGIQLQVPPMYSAVKKDGIPMYRLARQGVEVEREAREINVLSLTVEDIRLPVVAFTLRCSRGTYVRTVAHDLGMKLGCGAHLTELRRLASGPFGLSRALSLEALEQGGAMQGLVSLQEALSHLPECRLTPEGVRKVGFGISPAPPDCGCELPGMVRLSTPEGVLMAVASREEQGGTLRYRLQRVFR